MQISTLRLIAVVGAVLGFALLGWRRRGRVLGRRELLAWVALAGVAAIAVFPSLADALPAVTGLTGELSRITSLLVLAVLGLLVWVLSLQTDLEEQRAAFYRYLRIVAVEDALPEGTERAPLDVAIVMPALNEADNLPEVLARAPREVDGRSVRVIVVDDGSSDDTSAVAAGCGAIPVRSPMNAGGGHALQVGFLAARRLGATWVVTMDADGQHRFEDLPGVLAPLFAGTADVVVGSRHLGESVGHEAVRAIGLRVFNTLLSFLAGRRITDCSSGYRGFDRAGIDRLKLVQRRHHTAEMILEASRRGLRLVEVPITILPRVHGESKKGTNLLYGARFAATIASTWWRR